MHSCIATERAIQHVMDFCFCGGESGQQCYRACLEHKLPASTACYRAACTRFWRHAVAEEEESFDDTEHTGDDTATAAEDTEDDTTAFQRKEFWNSELLVLAIFC